MPQIEKTALEKQISARNHERKCDMEKISDSQPDIVLFLKLSVDCRGLKDYRIQKRAEINLEHQFLNQQSLKAFRDHFSNIFSKGICKV